MQIKIYTKLTQVVLIGLFLVLTSFSSQPAPEPKITICHLAPGNTDNRQTLTISLSALQAHLDHGDFIGTCRDSNDNGSNGNGPGSNDGILVGNVGISVP